jgi:aminoglycoside 2''-phosphotransferase
MSDPPWHSDAGLDAARAAALLASLDSRFRDADVEPVQGGWDFDTFCVDGEWFFRFPKRDEVVAGLREEWRVLDAVARIELPFQVPDHVFRVEPSEAFARPYCGYRRCPGEPLILADPPCTGSLERFTDFIDRIAGLDVDLPRPEAVGFGSWQDYGLSRLDRLGDHLSAELWQSARSMIESGAEPSREIVFSHDDLGPDHLLVDASGEIASVIDWTDSGYGDPAADWSGAVLAWGLEPVRAAAPRHPESFWTRVRVRTALGAVAMVWFGASEDRPDYVRWGTFALESVL